MLKKNHRSFFDRYEVIDSSSYANFKDFCGNFVKSLKVKILIQGNVIESRAVYIAQLIQNNLKINENTDVKPLGATEIHQIPLGSSVLRVKSLRQFDKNSVVKNYYQIGKADLRTECIAEFLVNVLNEPLFDVLRTHEQLGYGIACTLRKNSGTLGITITVEYQENSAEVIDGKIEEFLNNFQKTLSETSIEEFSSVQKSIVSLKLISDTELEKEVNRHWEEIRNGENMFDRNELEAYETESLTKQNVVDFFIKTFLTNKRKLSVQVIGEEKRKSDKITNKMSSDEEKSYCRSFVLNITKFKDHLEIIE